MGYFIADGARYDLVVDGVKYTPPTRLIKLINLAPDPSFEEGTGWAVNGQTTMYDHSRWKYGGTSLKMIGVEGSPETVVESIKPPELNSKHVYYARLEFYIEEVVSGLGFYWPIAEPVFGFGLFNQPVGTWGSYSWRNTRETFSDGQSNMRIDFDNNLLQGVVWCDGVVLIDLTEAFGAGEEPSKEWCDANIPFFEHIHHIEILRE